jgi:proline dehydrogenase
MTKKEGSDMSFYRKAILTMAGNRAVTTFGSKYGLKLGAARFVAGETLTEALQAIKEVNAQGLVATLDHLGESVHRREEALSATQAAVDIFHAIAESELASNVSVKLTQLGLDIDPDFCLANVDRIAAKAKEKNNFLRIDMEDTPRLESTMEIFTTLLDRYGKEHIGLVIQSYLYRSEEDIRKLAQKKVNLRIVKGAYREPAEVAYPAKKETDANYIKLVQIYLLQGCYTAIATHDEQIINQLKAWIKAESIADHLYEFQMLYGVRNALQRELVRAGYKVRVYIPYGSDWYPYFTRRIAESPANAFFVLKNLFQS